MNGSLFWGEVGESRAQLVRVFQLIEAAPNVPWVELEPDFIKPSSHYLNIMRCLRGWAQWEYTETMFLEVSWRNGPPN